MYKKDEILQRLLDAIPDEYNKSEGSFFYDNLASIALELERGYTKQNHILDQAFVHTATGDYLDQLCEEKGVHRKKATRASGEVTITGNEGAMIHQGDQVASDTLTFTIQEEKIVDETGQAEVLVECNEEGSIGNVPVGAIKTFPSTLIGLKEVTNKTAFTNGYNEETDEELRKRYFIKVQIPATSGNANHYKLWAKEIHGVGDARVYPLWNGNGTVKVVIIDSNKKGASTELISEVAQYIEVNRPIGATVTVESATEVPIHVSCHLTYDQDNYSIEEVIQAIENKLASHFKDIAFNQTYVSYAYIISAVLSSEGVFNCSDLKVNGEMKDITIGDTQVAVLGSVTHV